MAAYNEERHIRESLESILQQSYTNFELIIINDGSTDDTERIIQSYTDPRIRYMRNEQNLKLIESLNKGLRAATGKYIARMDADDIAMPDRIEIQVRFMEAHPEIGLSGAQLELFGDLSGTMRYPCTHEDIQLHLLMTSAFGNNVVIFRKDLMEKHNLFFPQGYLHAEDYKCWTRWILHTKAANLDTELVKYRSHAGSVSVKHRALQRETRNRVRIEYMQEIFGLVDSAAIRDWTSRAGKKKYKALRFLLRRNESMRVFDQQKLKAALLKVWYLDSLEEAETGVSIVFRFPSIFRAGMGKNFVNWTRVFKHYLAFKRT
jgi:glycosyltransferase involved in cell wall biosynthesis